MSVSRPMRILLTVTLLLTALSYGVRSWRESAALPPVIDGAAPARLNSGPAAEPGGDPASPQPIRSNELLRPIWPTASIDAMAPRATTPGLPGTAAADPGVPAATASPALPGPAFRVVGRYVDGKKSQVFFIHGNELIAAGIGQPLPDGFVLKAANSEKVTVVRTVDGHLFDMTLEAP
ncbi:MAG TPA: hypothetical protein PLW86_02120 [Rhodocyclaceae bacterium]|nr:hypothetical protein [Rhodocyclaceae bacterium]